MWTDTRARSIEISQRLGRANSGETFAKQKHVENRKLPNGSKYIKELKIDVYGNRLTSDTLFAMKTKSFREMFYL